MLVPLLANSGVYDKDNWLVSWSRKYATKDKGIYIKTDSAWLLCRAFDLLNLLVVGN